MSILFSTGAMNQAQSPRGFWDCLCFVNNDIQLARDPSIGAVYSVSAEPGSYNPWYPLPSNLAAAQLSKRRDIRYGEWDWYGIAVNVPSSYQPTSWGVLTQFEYPSITSPPLAIALDRHGLGIDRNAGSVSADSSGYMRAAVVERQRFFKLSRIADKWVEIIVGVKWAADDTGAVEAWAKCRACGDSRFALRWSRRNTPTMQYRAGEAPPAAGLDEQGIYVGNYSSSAVVPKNRVTETGLVIATSRAGAEALLPSMSSRREAVHLKAAVPGKSSRGEK